LVLGLAGRDREVPELSDEVPYDPFKVDIFTIGNVLRREFVGNYSNLGFFIPLIEAMTESDPSRRPSAEHALQQWRTIRGRINFFRRFWRLRLRGEPLWAIPLLDIIYVLESIPRFTRLLGRGLRRVFARIYSQMYAFHDLGCPPTIPY